MVTEYADVDPEYAVIAVQRNENSMRTSSQSLFYNYSTLSPKSLHPHGEDSNSLTTIETMISFAGEYHVLPRGRAVLKHPKASAPADDT